MNRINYNFNLTFAHPIDSEVMFLYLNFLNPPSPDYKYHPIH